MKGYKISIVTLVAGAFLAQAWAGCGSCANGDKAKAKSDCGSCEVKKEKASDCGSCTKQVKSACGKACATSDKKSCKTGCAKPCCAKAAEEKHAEIDTSAVEVLVKSGVAVILDARTGKYDDGERIPGAKALAAGSDAEEVAGVIPSKDALVVTYCSNVKCPASGKLAAHLKDLGYTNVLEYPKGIAGWKEAGNSVEQAE